MNILESFFFFFIDRLVDLITSIGFIVFKCSGNKEIFKGTLKLSKFIENFPAWTCKPVGDMGDHWCIEGLLADLSMKF